jgi:hypothetical protein
MIFGKQTHYCPNCGTTLYDSNLSMNHILSMCCSDECRTEWNLKYSRFIIGKDGSEPTLFNIPNRNPFTEKQRSAIAKAIMENYYTEMNALKASGEWIKENK